MVSLSNIDLRLLRIFETIVDCGGFTPAEVELNLSAATISNSMSDLETRLGMRLCNRGRGGFSLTEEGKIVYGSFARLRTSLADFEADVGAARGHLTGSLNLALIDGTISNPGFLLTDAISDFRANAGDVHLNIQICSPNEIERGVIDGRNHIGVGTAYHNQSSLTYKSLYTEVLDLYCGVNNPIFHKDLDNLDPEILKTLNYVTRGYVGPQAKPSAGFQLNSAATAFQVEGIATLILTGDFIGFLPRHFAQVWVDQGTMKPILKEVVSYEVEHKIITRKDAIHNPVVKNFMQVMLKRFDKA